MGRKPSQWLIVKFCNKGPATAPCAFIVVSPGREVHHPFKIMICMGLTIGTRHRGEGFYSGAFYEARACPLASRLEDRAKPHHKAIRRYWAASDSSSALDWVGEDGQRFMNS